MFLRQIAGGIHLTADVQPQQVTDGDLRAGAVKVGAVLRDAHQVGRAGDGVEVADRAGEEIGCGEIELITAAVQGVVAHSVRVKVQQAQAAVGIGDLKAVLLQHGQLPGGHVYDGRAALGVIGGQERLYRQLSAGRVEGGHLQDTQVGGQRQTGGLSARR